MLVVFLSALLMIFFLIARLVYLMIFDAEKLGFKWLVMSDWNSVWDLEKVIKSGQNLEMP